MNKYHVRQGVELIAEFKSGTMFVDPPTVTLRLQKPDETQLTLVYGVDADVLRDSAGKYRYKFLPGQEGEWVYCWEGSSPAQAGKEDKFKVIDSVFF